jgi:hypothetical protein
MSKSQLLVTVSIFLLSANIYAGNKNPILDEEFTLSLSAYDLKANGDITTQSIEFNNQEFTITLDDIGLETEVDTFWIDAKWRPFERWSFMAEYFSYSESSSASRNVETVYQNIVFGANKTLKADFDVDILSLSTAYRFLDGENYALDFGVGVHAMDISFSLEGAGEVYADNTVTTSNNIKKNASILAPLPNVMLYGTYAFNEYLSLSGRAGWLSVNYGKYEGDLRRANVTLEYRPLEHIGFGLGYNYSELDIVREGRTLTEIFNIDFSGPLLTVKAGF